jgi:phenylpyruvate tautomerase PptA (4-oxalocrotonate tautomerase family)
MPHIVVKLRAGYSGARKARLAKALTTAIVQTLDCPAFDVSVGIEDVSPADWTDGVARADVSLSPIRFSSGQDTSGPQRRTGDALASS